MRTAFLALLAWLVWSSAALSGDRGMCARAFYHEGSAVVHFSITRIADFEDGSSAWLTAGHCVENDQTVQIPRDNGPSIFVKVVSKSKTPDVALLRGPQLVQKSYFRLVERAPSRATICSYVGPRNKHYDIALSDSDDLMGNVKAEQGESGAPVYDRDECFGLLIGNTQDVKECGGVDFYGRSVCRIRPGRVIFERSRTINRWLRTTGYQPCEPNNVPPQPQPEPQPTPSTQPAQTSLDCDCVREIAVLKARIKEIERIRSVPGPPGRDGVDGPSGKVTVILEDNGKQIFKQSGVPAGSVVRVPIRRVEKSSSTVKTLGSE